MGQTYWLSPGSSPWEMRLLERHFPILRTSATLQWSLRQPANSNVLRQKLASAFQRVATHVGDIEVILCDVDILRNISEVVYWVNDVSVCDEAGNQSCERKRDMGSCEDVAVEKKQM